MIYRENKTETILAIELGMSRVSMVSGIKTGPRLESAASITPYGSDTRTCRWISPDGSTIRRRDLRSTLNDLLDSLSRGGARLEVDKVLVAIPALHSVSKQIEVTESVPGGLYSKKNFNRLRKKLQSKAETTARPGDGYTLINLRGGSTLADGKLLQDTSRSNRARKLTRYAYAHYYPSDMLEMIHETLRECGLTNVEICLGTVAVGTAIVHPDSIGLLVDIGANTSSLTIWSGGTHLGIIWVERGVESVVARLAHRCKISMSEAEELLRTALESRPLSTPNSTGANRLNMISGLLRDFVDDIGDNALAWLKRNNVEDPQVYVHGGFFVHSFPRELLRGKLGLPFAAQTKSLSFSFKDDLHSGYHYSACLGMLEAFVKPGSDRIFSPEPERAPTYLEKVRDKLNLFI